MKRFPFLLVLVLLAAGLPGPAPAAQPAPPERVLVTDVVDGDTIIVLRGRRQDTVRLIGVDTPETGRPDRPVQFYGPEAADFARRTLLERRVRLEFDDPDRVGGQRDAYRRLLAYVFTEDGANFNLELVQLGYGRAFTRFPFKYTESFKQAEREARTAGRGLWNAAVREEWSDPSRRGKIIGNLRTRIYHVPGQAYYDKVREKNRIYFRTEEDARKAGYRKAKN